VLETKILSIMEFLRTRAGEFLFKALIDKKCFWKKKSVILYWSIISQ